MRNLLFPKNKKFTTHMLNKPVTSRGFTLIELLVAVAIVAVLIGLLVPAVMRIRGQAEGVRCQNNLRQLAVAFQGHHADHGAFPTGGWDWFTPPTYVAGGPVVGRDQKAGWGFQILPYVEARSVWESGPRAAVAAQLPVFFCSVRRPPQTVSYPDEYTPPLVGLSTDIVHGLTDYAASNLSNTGAVRQYEPVRIADITDGTTSTLLLAEKRINLALMSTAQPDDNEGYTAGFDEDTVRTTDALPLPDFRGVGSAGQLFGGSHPGVVFAAFCDGSVRPVRYTVAADIFSRLGDRADGLPASLD